MINLEKKVDALIQYILADGYEERETAKDNLLRMEDKTDRKFSAEDRIRDVLLELGIPDHLKGHPYLVAALSYVLEDPSLVGQITKGIYLKVASDFGASPSKVERAIRHAIESTWLRGDPDIHKAYFGNTILASKGKPTNSEFIARVANALRRGI